MAKVGAKPKYETVEEMQKVIDAYFERCQGKLLLDPDGNPILDKWGQPIVYDKEMPTMAGLAYELGFTSRQSLLNYKKKGEFLDTITRAKLYIEARTATGLFHKDSYNGSRWTLELNHGCRVKEDDDDKPDKGGGVIIIPGVDG